MHGKVNSFFETFIPSAIALFAVWLCMGIWHGASWQYVFYGLYYYFLTILGMCLEPLHKKFYEKTKLKSENIIFRIIRILRTFILVNIGMLIFRATDTTTAFSMLFSIFSKTSQIYLFDLIAVKDFVVFLIGIVIIVVIDCLWQAKINLYEKFSAFKPIFRYLIILCVFFAIIIFGAYGQGYTFIDPMYGGF